MLNKKYRLNGDYDDVFKNGDKIRGKYGMVIGKEDESLENSLFAVVIPKKVGKATQRNRFKRRVRAIIQGLIDEKFFDGIKARILYIAFECPEDYPSLEKESSKQFDKLVKNLKK